MPSKRKVVPGAASAALRRMLPCAVLLLLIVATGVQAKPPYTRLSPEPARQQPSSLYDAESPALPAGAVSVTPSDTEFSDSLDDYDEAPTVTIADPLEPWNRFWFAFNRHPEDASRHYTYCWDCRENQAWQINKGFKDDFYRSGYVTELSPMDLKGNQYFYCKNGEEVSREFPDAADSTVVFIVNLKG